MSYKDLSLDRDKIEEVIKQYPNINVDGPTNVNASLIRYTLSNPSQKDNNGILNIHLNKGTVSFSFQGQNKEITLAVADYLKEKCTKGSLKHQTLTIANFGEEKFNIFKEYLIEECKAEVVEANILHGIQYTFTGRYKDSLTIKHYNTKKVVIQGKQQFLFTELTEILADLGEFKTIIEKQLEVLEISSSIDETIKEFKEILPSSYTYLGNTLIAIISPSLTFRKINVSLTDYSSFVFPVLRGLEGFLKKILGEYSIEVSKDGFGEIFEKKYDKHGEYFLMKSEYEAKINNGKISSMVVDIYKYYKIHRHGLFHIDKGIETSRIISNQTEANTVINKIIEIIEDSCITLQKERGK